MSKSYLIKMINLSKGNMKQPLNFDSLSYNYAYTLIKKEFFVDSMPK
jgi:hypothetical protein